MLNEIETAKLEAEQIINNAKEEAKRLLSESFLLEAIKKKADEIKEQVIFDCRLMQEKAYGNLALTKYSYTQMISPILWKVKNQEKYGVVDSLGNIVVPVEYDDIIGIEDDKIKVILENKEEYYEL